MIIHESIPIEHWDMVDVGIHGQSYDPLNMGEHVTGSWLIRPPQFDDESINALYDLLDRQGLIEEAEQVEEEVKEVEGEEEVKEVVGERLKKSDGSPTESRIDESTKDQTLAKEQHGKQLIPYDVSKLQEQTPIPEQDRDEKLR